MPVENARSTFARNGAQPHPVFWMHQSKPVMSVDAEPGVSAQAILSEIEERALRFAATGEEASIDLRCLKAMPEEREMLEALLGRGEVSAVLDALGCSEIHETAISCVWWVRHRNADDEIAGELIEIAEVPDVLKGDRSAIASGLQVLRNSSPFLMRRQQNITTQTNER